jgi:hypothetical protein
MSRARQRNADLRVAHLALRHRGDPPQRFGKDFRLLRAGDEVAPREDEASASGGGVCAQAQRCCEAIGAPPDACNNFGRIGVPDSVCSSALDGYKQAASAQGKSCD